MERVAKPSLSTRLPITPMPVVESRTPGRSARRASLPLLFFTSAHRSTPRDGRPEVLLRCPVTSSSRTLRFLRFLFFQPAKSLDQGRVTVELCCFFFSLPLLFIRLQSRSHLLLTDCSDGYLQL
ncbi:hypothetical protein BS78_03G335700 [Paspalum vaginatum]|nr:hypothetical protein BS78_03G335700 [Paspalum vaginatum]